ncbi:MAG: hypothetical protein KAT62_14990 [Desulfuromonadales bacterium]|nr:hypothetical protein [Desulfuromonadales bacterium]
MSQWKSLPEPDTADWEKLCERCGRCCYEKFDYRGRIFYTNTPCPHLDVTSNNCRIYHQRERLHPECARLTPDLVKAGILPADCPYVKNIENYSAPLMDGDPF